VLGGILGYFVVGPWQSAFPYLLVIAASSFVYVAVADLIPQLQKRLPARQTAAQILWLVAGIALVTLVSRLAHGEHGHEHGHDDPGHGEHGHVHKD